MDAITLIIEALEAGNAPDTGIETMVPDDVRDSWGRFSDLVGGRLAQSGASDLLERYEEQPDVWEGPLVDALAEAGAERDGELIDAAQAFMELVQIRRARHGDFTVDVPDDTGEPPFV